MGRISAAQPGAVRPDPARGLGALECFRRNLGAASSGFEAVFSVVESMNPGARIVPGDPPRAEGAKPPDGGLRGRGS